jgi:predicted nucleic acid-binding protein
VNFLLDTNVVSELVKLSPNARVVRWLFETDEDAVFLSVVTIAEIRYGIDGMSPGNRRDRLIVWLENDLIARFEPRILSVGLGIADAWGAMVARSNKIGKKLTVMDGFLAATAEIHGMTLVTRNIRHFENLGINLFNPWAVIP